MTRKIIFILLFISTDIFAQNPVASFTFSQTPGEECVYFTNASTGNIVTWTWRINENTEQQSFTTSNFNYCFPDTGCFDVKLVVQDNFGISDSVTHQVCIRRETTLYMPNVFTPNGDAKNDVFFVYGSLIPENKFEMRIYDYWGGLVFASFDINKGWDGAVQGSGEIAPMGYYLLELTWFDVHNEKQTYRGAIFLFK